MSMAFLRACLIEVFVYLQGTNMSEEDIGRVVKIIKDLYEV